MVITNREVFNSALGLIGQRIDGDCWDFEDRAPYILASFCGLTANINKAIYKAEKLGIPKAFCSVYEPLDSEFPMCSQLASSAALYLAAMLVIDENSELSDSLYEKYCNSIVPLQALLEEELDKGSNDSLAVCESIAQRYFFD